MRQENCSVWQTASHFPTRFPFSYPSLFLFSGFARSNWRMGENAHSYTHFSHMHYISHHRQFNLHLWLPLCSRSLFGPLALLSLRSCWPHIDNQFCHDFWTLVRLFEFSIYSLAAFKCYSRVLVFSCHICRCQALAAWPKRNKCEGNLLIEWQKTTTVVWEERARGFEVAWKILVLSGTRAHANKSVH